MARSLMVFDLRGRLLPDDPTIQTLAVVTRLVDLNECTPLIAAQRIRSAITDAESEQRKRDPTVIAVFREIQSVP
ncbi:MAG: hypothetical protein Q7S96_03200 [bacterium]|nr:hypothetical protein [bacterium]